MNRGLREKEWHSFRGSTAILIFALFASFFPLAGADASTTELLAKAKPDECFYGFGSPFNQFFPGPMEVAAGLVAGCTEQPAGPNGEMVQPKPKVNQSYIWGLVKPDKYAWFGTVSNTPCLVADSYFQGGCSTSLGLYSTCESCKRTSDPLSTDWRPPHIFRYDTTLPANPNSGLEEMTPNDELIAKTLGIRSAGKLGANVVVFAGPTVGTMNPAFGDPGINLFAFHTDGTYLGSRFFKKYDDIRKWVEVGGAVYTGVHNTSGGGSILRWRGTLTNYVQGQPLSEADLDALFQFEQVGILDAEAADLTVHEGCLFVSTWPLLERRLDYTKRVLAGLYQSPIMGRGGLTQAHANKWKKVWDVSRYEPDVVVRATYTLGALASFNGYLYWGTMHVPALATQAHILYYSDLYPNGGTYEQQLDVFYKTERATSIFRGVFSPSGSIVQLLYGEKTVPTFSPITKKWRNASTRAGTPLMGPSGFGNPANNYTWTMAVHKNKLYVGTCDYSFLTYTDPQFPPPTPNNYGSDLWVFPNMLSRATRVDQNGMGNITNYGIRNMVSDGDALYLGMANPFNLTTTQGLPQGGWELIKFQP